RVVRERGGFEKGGNPPHRSAGSFHSHPSLDFPVDLGAYKFSRRPEDPAVLFMLRTPCKPGLPVKDQHRAGRMELLQTPFSKFERNIRDKPARMLGNGGFDRAH